MFLLLKFQTLRVAYNAEKDACRFKMTGYIKKKKVLNWGGKGRD